MTANMSRHKKLCVHHSIKSEIKHYIKSEINRYIKSGIDHYLNSGSKTRIDGAFLRKVSGLPNEFAYKDLKTATNRFAYEIGRGGFGSVFSGTLSDGTKVAVKRLHHADDGIDEFLAELSALASLNHSNLVRLHGFCTERSHYLLVFEFMENGSLHDWLFNADREPLDWNTRYRIALQTARGIAYLHEDSSSSRILHLDIKPHNILLDEDFNAKVADFGLAKLLNKDVSRVVTVHVRGTPGYIAPEFVMEYAITAKSDVYSYGMVLLEIVSGRRVIDRSGESEQWYLPSIALDMLREGKLEDLFDRRHHMISAGAAEEMARAVKLAMWCIQNNSALRPNMATV
ncbi:hypothetical protein KI387_033392, partial [Taxus chinensis]